MKCRTIVNDEGVKQVVWFGSYGVDGQGHAKKADSSKSQVDSNFSTDLSAIAGTLNQQLSVMKGELWHNVRFGLPLLEKVKSKALIDAAVVDIVTKQKDVIGISSFSSSILQKEYHCNLVVQTSFGNITLEA